MDSIREGTLLRRAVCFREGSLQQSRGLGSTQLQDLVNSACDFGKILSAIYALFLQRYCFALFLLLNKSLPVFVFPCHLILIFFLPQEQAEGLSRYMVSLNVMVPHGILLWQEICAMDLKMLIRAEYYNPTYSWKNDLNVIHEDARGWMCTDLWVTGIQEFCGHRFLVLTEVKI